MFKVMKKISPLAPDSFPLMPDISGVRMSTAQCGIKYKDRADVLLVELSENSVVAGAFTKSKTASANIIWGRKILEHHKARILLVNSGNANAFNGRHGEESVARITKMASNLWNCDDNTIYPCATGVIGVPLPDNLITDSLLKLKNSLETSKWLEAAKTICTTDTFPKGATRISNIAGTQVSINGIAKGSGMIAPDMATMLAYIFTDAAIDANILQNLVSEALEGSFNSITVDSDTSTSDTLLVFATGKADNKKITNINDPILTDFKASLNEVMLDLAHQIVKDGEGASKFITIKVTGAENNLAARKIAFAIANSPLVKTAIAGEDANWGRIVMAVGKAGEAADRDKMSVAVGGIQIVKNGQLNPAYQEKEVTNHMKTPYIDILVDVGIDYGFATVWTCDLTHRYIDINADYRS